VVVAPANDLTESLTIEIPADAKASVNELQTVIAWKIVIQRKAAFGDADRDFVFRVV
jgi:hypothetical protein